MAQKKVTTPKTIKNTQVGNISSRKPIRLPEKKDENQKNSKILIKLEEVLLFWLVLVDVSNDNRNNNNRKKENTLIS
jgi:hypothetical protein